MSSTLGPRVVRELVGIWDRAGVNYAFTHGVEHFPDATGRDVDLLVQPNHIARATQQAESHFRTMGWKFVAHRRVNGHRWCFVAPPDSTTVFEFDLVPRLRWGPTIFTSIPRPSARVGSLKVDPWASFVKRILLQILGGNFGKLERHPGRLDTTAEELAETPALAKYLGNTLSANFLAALEWRDLDRLRSLVPQMRQALVFRSLGQRPDRTLTAVADWVLTEIASSPFGRPIVPTVAVVGVDGVGKSSVIEQLIAEIPARLPVVSVQRRHWRPEVLPDLASLFGKGTPWDGVAKPPRRIAGRAGVLRALYYGLDFYLGGWWKDRREASQLTAVVYDRCALDMHVDPLRFGLRASAPIRFITALMPHPEIVVLLHDTAERIRSRKAELRVEEIERQQTEWTVLAQLGRVHHILPVGSSPHLLACEIADRLVESFFGAQSHQSVKNLKFVPASPAAPTLDSRG